MRVHFGKIREALNRIRATVPKSSVVESHKLICIQDNKLQSFNGDAGTSTFCELPGFRFCVPAQDFIKLVDALGSKEGTLTHEDGWLHARVGEYESKFPTRNVIDFPDFMPKGGLKVFCSATNLIPALRACASAMDDDAGRMQINGIAFHGTSVYSTDQKRLTRATLNSPSHADDVLSLAKPAIQQILKLGQPKYLFIADSKVGALYEEQRTVLVARGTVGKFPFRMVDDALNTARDEWSVPVPDGMLEAIERVVAMVRDEESQLLVKCNGSWLEIATNATEQGSAVERIPFTIGKPFSIKIKAATLRSSLRQLKPTHINLTDIMTQKTPRMMMFSGPSFQHACALMS